MGMSLIPAEPQPPELIGESVGMVAGDLEPAPGPVLNPIVEHLASAGNWIAQKASGPQREREQEMEAG